MYQPLGVEYQIASTIRLEDNLTTAFALARHDPDYTEWDRAILEMLRPHLVVAFNNLALKRTHQNLLNCVTLALDELDSATVIVDPQSRILYHTGAGLRRLWATSPGVLPAAIIDWLKEYRLNGFRETLILIAPDAEIHVGLCPPATVIDGCWF